MATTSAKTWQVRIRAWRGTRHTTHNYSMEQGMDEREAVRTAPDRFREQYPQSEIGEVSARLGYPRGVT